MEKPIDRSYVHKAGLYAPRWEKITIVIEKMILSINSASDTLARTAYDETDVHTLSIVRVTRDCGLCGNGGD